MAQLDKLYNLLKDGNPHRTDEIVAKVYGNEHLGLSRVGARIYDLKKKYNIEIDGWKDSDNTSLYWYQIRSKGIFDLSEYELSKKLKELKELAKIQKEKLPIYSQQMKLI